MPEKPLIKLPPPDFPAPDVRSYRVRRTSDRFPFTALAMVFDLSTYTRVSGRTGDLSYGGCYVDTISPFPVGTKVRVCVDHSMRKFEAQATVTYAPPSLGMGLAFTEIKPGHQNTLEKWISELTGASVPEYQYHAGAIETGSSSAIGNVRQVVNQLITLMIRRNIIDEKEGTDLLRQIFH